MTAARRAVAVVAILLLVGCGRRDRGGADAVAVKTGERFTVTLAENASTGFTWRLARPLDERVVRLVEVAYHTPDAKLAGAGGEELWTFEAAGAGAATIELEYVRPWEHDVPALQTRTIAVSVSPRPRPGEPLALASPELFAVVACLRAEPCREDPAARGACDHRVRLGDPCVVLVDAGPVLAAQLVVTRDELVVRDDRFVVRGDEGRVPCVDVLRDPARVRALGVGDLRLHVPQASLGLVDRPIEVVELALGRLDRRRLEVQILSGREQLALALPELLPQDDRGDQDGQSKKPPHGCRPDLGPPGRVLEATALPSC
jgi:inhibitor of cysteine peptidase